MASSHTALVEPYKLRGPLCFFSSILKIPPVQMHGRKPRIGGVRLHTVRQRR